VTAVGWGSQKMGSNKLLLQVIGMERWETMGWKGTRRGWQGFIPGENNKRSKTRTYRLKTEEGRAQADQHERMQGRNGKEHVGRGGGKGGSKATVVILALQKPKQGEGEKKKEALNKNRGAQGPTRSK